MSDALRKACEKEGLLANFFDKNVPGLPRARVTSAGSLPST